MTYFDRAQGLVYAWEHNYDKDLTDRDRDGLVRIIADGLRKAAWQAQQPSAPIVGEP